MKLKKIAFYLLFLAFFVAADAFAEKGTDKYEGTYGKGDISITLATGTPGSLGLVRAIAEPFCKKNNCKINWIERGSGESLKALKTGEADIIMVHAPEAEEKAVNEGWAVNRTLIGGNEFYIVGPASDPANIKNAGSVVDAYKKIAATGSLFFTRNDNSGTHKKEMMIWKKTGLKPSGAWYVATNDFMEPTLMRADSEGGYFMTDSSTYVAEKSKLQHLEIIFRGDPLLLNVYHALVTPEGSRPGDVFKTANRFIDFIKSEEGQKIIGEFGKKEYGFALYLTAKQAASTAH